MNFWSTIITCDRLYLLAVISWVILDDCDRLLSEECGRILPDICDGISTIPQVIATEVISYIPVREATTVDVCEVVLIPCVESWTRMRSMLPRHDSSWSFHWYMITNHYSKNSCPCWNHTFANKVHHWAWEAWGFRPSAFQVLMMHWVGKCVISTWAWVPAFIPWLIRNFRAARWKSRISTHPLSVWILFWSWDIDWVEFNIPWAR